MLGIIVASNRKTSQSKKIGLYIKQQLEQQHASKDDVHLIDLQKLSLPLWSEEAFTDNAQWEKVSKQLKKITAFVIVVPEWDGMACPTVKNFFNYCRSHELFHKPALLVAVSAGGGGAYPIAELRMSSYKNSHICYIPEQVIVRQAESVLNEEVAYHDGDKLIRARIDFALKVLLRYQAAMRQIVSEGFMLDPDFINGM